MKVKSYLQFYGKELELDSLEKRVKAIWKEQGKLQKDIKMLEVYIKIEENMCYYIINQDIKGNFPLD